MSLPTRSDARAAARKRWRAANREKENAATRRRRRANPEREKQAIALWRASQRSVIEAAKAKPCADCGGTFPSVVMDFDHVRGDKLFNIGSAGAHHGRQALLDEIAKCEVVCANCHRLRTLIP